jgi:hypothetical protein
MLSRSIANERTTNFQQRGPPTLGWSYAMEAVSAHDPTAHAKLIDEKMQDGNMRPFPTGGINLKGLSSLEKFGVAAEIRQRVEEELEPHQVHVVWSRYADLARGE